MDQGQTYNPKCNPKRLTNRSLGFNWDGSACSAQSTETFCEQISLVKTFCRYLDQYLPFPNEKLTLDTTHTYIVNEHLTFSCMNIPTYNIRGTAQWGK